MKYLLITFIILCSCSAQKKLNRLVKKHPELMQVDTIHFQDTLEVITKRVHTDTLTTLKNITHDTLIITKENLKIKTFYNYHTDSIYISGECQSDTVTVIREIDIPYEKVVVEELSWWRKWSWLIILIGFALLFVIALIKK